LAEEMFYLLEIIMGCCHKNVCIVIYIHLIT
jgi:hypothetical protein